MAAVARSIAIILLLSGSNSVDGAELGAGVPPGWSGATLREHNITIRQASSPGPADRASLLVSYELTAPTVLVDLGELADGLLAPLQLEIGAERDLEAIPGVVYREFSATQADGPAHDVAVVALEEGDRQQVVLFAALPVEYRSLGGADFMLHRLTRFPSVADLRRARISRRDAIGADRSGSLADNRAGVALTGERFAVLVEAVELLAGARLTAGEVASFRQALVAQWKEDDTATDEVAELTTLLGQIEAMTPIQRVQAVASWYTNAWRFEREQGETSALMDAVYAFNPVRAHRDGVVLSERALQARLRSIELYLGWGGGNEKEIARALDAARERIPRDFLTMSDPHRQALANAQSRWLAAWSWSANASPEQKSEAVEAARLWSNNSSNPVELGHALEYHLQTQAQHATLLNLSGFLQILPDLQMARPN